MKKLLFLWALLISTVLQVNAQTWQWTHEFALKNSATDVYFYNEGHGFFLKATSSITDNPDDATLFNIEYRRESSTDRYYISYQNGSNYVNQNNGSASWGTSGYGWYFDNNRSGIVIRTREISDSNKRSISVYNNSENDRGISYPKNDKSTNATWLIVSPDQIKASKDYIAAYNAAVAKYAFIPNELMTANYSDVHVKIAKLNQISNYGFFNNPLTSEDAADPAVIKAHDGYYYMYTSEPGAGTGIKVWRSANMVEWQQITTIFAKRPNGVGYTFLWAPDIAYIDGKYVLYYANAEWGNQASTQICVATSDNPYGPFENNKILINASNSDNGALNANVDNVIDPHLLEDGDNKYLVWGSWHGIHYIKLTADGTSLAESSRHNLVNGRNDTWSELEAPMVFKKDGYYYLIGSYGNTLDQDGSNPYMMRIARGQTLGGTFRNKSNTTLNGSNTTDWLVTNDFVKNPGHCSKIIIDDKGNEYIFFHGYAKKDGNWDFSSRVLFMSPVTYDSNGWPVIEAPSATAKFVYPFVSIPTIEYPNDYEISTADELMAFAEKTRDGQTWINAKLMNDIDMSGKTWYPIGKQSSPFRGTIDGQGFRIKNLIFDNRDAETDASLFADEGNGNRQGLVGTAMGGAKFIDLILDSSCDIKGGKYTGGFIGRADGTGRIDFVRCGNEANVTGGINTAGFIGCSSGVSIYWNDCYNMGNINGTTESAAFSGWGADQLVNCWNTGRTMGCEGAGNGKWNSLTRGMSAEGYVNTYDLNSENAPLDVNVLANYDASWLKNGALCYIMNNGRSGENVVWTQKVEEIYGEGKEEHPTFGSMEVKKAGSIYHNRDYYTRDITDGRYGTICLPYASSSFEGAEFYEVAGVRENSNEEICALVLKPLEGQLEAGKPYVFLATRSGEGENGLKVVYNMNASVGDDVTEGKSLGMIGNLTMDTKVVDDGSFFLRNTGGRTVISITSDKVRANIASCRAYFTFDEKIPVLDKEASLAKTYLVFGLDGVEDDADAIEALNAETINDTYYNMMGQRVNANAKGLVIKSGKKYLNK